MWCPDDIGRDSWDWVGPPAWGRACVNSPEWGGGSSPVKTEPPQIVLLLLLLFLFLFLRRVNEEVMHIATQLHVFIRHATETWCRVTRESDSRRLRHLPEPSSTHSCGRSRARKTGAQLRDTRRSAKNDAKCVKKPLHRCNTTKSSTILCCTSECPPGLAMNRI